VDALHAAALYAAAGRPDRARRLVRAARTGTDSAGTGALHVARAVAMGEIALAEGRGDAAADWFRRSEVGIDGLPVSACTVCVLPYLARAAERAGRRDEARALWARYATTPSLDREDTDAWFLAMARRRMREPLTARALRSTDRTPAPRT
jgi:hypothetical protein